MINVATAVDGHYQYDEQAQFLVGLLQRVEQWLESGEVTDLGPILRNNFGCSLRQKLQIYLKRNY
jgi:hypothetical protein